MPYLIAKVVVTFAIRHTDFGLNSTERRKLRRRRSRKKPQKQKILNINRIENDNKNQSHIFVVWTIKYEKLETFDEENSKKIKTSKELFSLESCNSC